MLSKLFGGLSEKEKMQAEAAQEKRARVNERLFGGSYSHQFLARIPKEVEEVIGNPLNMPDVKTGMYFDREKKNMFLPQVRETKKEANSSFLLFFTQNLFTQIQKTII